MKRLLLIALALCLCAAPLALAEQTPPAVGDVIVYGRYEQDNDFDNGKEPLEWIVLEVKDDQAFLISRYCLETRQFYPKRVPMYWKNSTLREWMNNNMLNAAFTDEEQERILTSTVTHHNPHGMKGGGDDTQDKLYLLSRVEVRQYFPTQESRVAYPTEYAKSQGCTLDPDTGSCRWWLRTPGARPMDVFGIRIDGRISAYGMQDVDWKTNTVRPVMWLRLSD